MDWLLKKCPPCCNTSNLARAGFAPNIELCFPKSGHHLTSDQERAKYWWTQQSILHSIRVLVGTISSIDILSVHMHEAVFFSLYYTMQNLWLHCFKSSMTLCKETPWNCNPLKVKRSKVQLIIISDLQHHEMISKEGNSS